MLSFKNWIKMITTCITQIKAPVTTLTFNWIMTEQGPLVLSSVDFYIEFSYLCKCYDFHLSTPCTECAHVFADDIILPCFVTGWNVWSKEFMFNRITDVVAYHMPYDGTICISARQ